MKVEYVLDQIHTSITHRWYLQLFTVFTRCLLGIAFIPPSIPKILHRPFTALPDSNPVGHYFNALLQTGFYYEFLGWSQLIAAILLLIPRTAHLGALMFLPIIINIAVLTNGVGFKGTWLLTILMSFAATWLVAWEYDRLKPIIFQTRREQTRTLPFQHLAIPLLFGIGGAVSGLFAYLIGLGNLSNYLYVSGLLAIGGAVFGFIVSIHYRFMRIGNLETTRD